MRGKWIFLTGIIFFTSSCNQHPGGDQEADDLMGVQAIFWTQYSAEAEALYYQGYNIASNLIMDYERGASGVPPAVILDIDETVLDNSPFNVHLLRQGENYSDKLWAEWCMRVEAQPLPGSVEFTQLADSLGIEVFYISNRQAQLMEVTLQNLKKYGFPFADTAHVLLKTKTSSKDLRRERVRRDHQIILLAGDNLGDFDGIFDDRGDSYGKGDVKDFRESFGTRFIVFPNPMYGRWQRAVFPDGVPAVPDVLKELRGY